LRLETKLICESPSSGSSGREHEVPLTASDNTGEKICVAEPVRSRSDIAALRKFFELLHRWDSKHSTDERKS
jgi:hypothetical protein